jgi:hypothetical protein
VLNCGGYVVDAQAVYHRALLGRNVKAAVKSSESLVFFLVDSFIFRCLFYLFSFCLYKARQLAGYRAR